MPTGRLMGLYSQGKNVARVAVQVEEEIEQPFRGFLTHQGNLHVQNVKKIGNPMLLFLYEPVPNVKYRTETCARTARICSQP